jgi:hypothetical protein
LQLLETLYLSQLLLLLLLVQSDGLMRAYITNCNLNLLLLLLLQLELCKKDLDYLGRAESDALMGAMAKNPISKPAAAAAAAAAAAGAD